jgi:hypothetical protein
MNPYFWIFWSVLVVITLPVGWKWFQKPSRDNALFFGFMILLTSILYSVVVLDLVVTNNTVTKAQATKEEIKKIAELIVKTAFVLSDGSARFDGTPLEHRKKLEEYARELASITKGDSAELMENVNRTIKGLNNSINKRIQGDRK